MRRRLTGFLRKTKRASINTEKKPAGRNRRNLTRAGGMALSLTAIVGGVFWFMQPAQADYLQQGNLIGYWPLDTAADVSGYANDVNFVNGASLTTTVPSTSFDNSHSLSLNGSNRAQVTSTTANDMTTGDFTMAAWVKTSNPDNGFQYIMSKRSDKSGYEMGIRPDGSLYLMTGNGSESFVSESKSYAGTDLNDDTWHQVAISVNRSSGIATYYIDGHNAGTTDISTDVSPGTSLTNASPLTIGETSDPTLQSTNPQYLTGNIDDLRLYDRVLSGAEIGELASGDNTSATWTGATSTAFNDSDNWDIGAVPDAYTNIMVAATDNSVVLNTATGLANFAIESGATFNLNGQDLIVNSNGEFINNGTLKLTGNETLTGFVNDTGNTGTVWYNGSGSHSGLAAGNAYHSLKFSGDSSWTFGAPESTVTITSDLSIGNGVTLNAGSSTINLAGNFQNSGTFNAGTGTVNLNGYQQQITGNNTFYNLTDENDATTGSLTFPAGSTQTVTNSLALTGAGGGYLTVQSSKAGQQWKLDVQNDYYFYRLNVKDSNNISGGLPLSSTDSIGSGYTNWNLDTPSVTNFGPSTVTYASWINETKPTFTFTTSDSDSPQVKYELVVYNMTTGSTVIDYRTDFATPGDVTFTVGQAAGAGTYGVGGSGQALASGIYRWYVMVTDNGDNGGLTTTQYAPRSYIPPGTSQYAAFIVDADAPSVPVSSLGDSNPYGSSQVATLTSVDEVNGSGLDRIRYTTDGSDPTATHGTAIGSGGTVTISTDTTLKAVAYDNAGNVSAIMTKNYVIDTTNPNKPTVDVSGGTYNTDKTVTVSATDNADGTGVTSLYYTTNNQEPSSAQGTKITGDSGTITVSTSETLKVIAYDAVGNPSDILTEEYTIDKIKPSKPVANVAAGPYSEAQTITLSSTDDLNGTGLDHIYYTLDGSDPTTSSTVYDDPITISSTKTLKAVAYDNAGNVSDMLVSEYIVDLTPPIASINSTGNLGLGVWTQGTQPTMSFNISEDGGGQVKYQIQIGAGGFSSPVVNYTSALSSDGDKTFTVGQAAGSGSYADGSSGQELDDGVYSWRVRAINSLGVAGDWVEPTNSSFWAQVDTTTPNTPSANVAAGVYGTVQSVTLSATDQNDGSGIDHIYYTTDGSDPTTSDAIYDTPISVDSTQTIKAIAYDEAGNVSGILSNEYTIDLSSPDTQLDGFANTNGSTSDTTPTLNFTTKVTGGGQVKYQIQIDDSTSFGTPIIDYTSDFASAGTASFTVGQAAGSGTYTLGADITTLGDGNYDWRVRTITTKGLVSAWVTADEENMMLAIDTAAPNAPSSSLAVGNYADSQSTTLSASDAAGGSGIDHIYYTTDGSTPSKTNGTMYTAAISITKSETIKAIAYDKVGNASTVASFSYNIDTTAPDKPTASVVGGSYNNPQTIKLTVNDNAGGVGIDGIYYTTDGSTPSKTNGAKIQSGGTVFINTDTTLKAIAYDKAGNVSKVMTEKYQIDITPPDAPSASLPVNVYKKAQTVKLTADDNADGSGIDAIYYTTDGTTPSKTNGIKYTEPIKVGSSQAIKAVAYDKAGNGSPFMTTAYIISAPSNETPSKTPPKETKTDTPSTTKSSSGATKNVTIVQGGEEKQAETPKPKIVTKVVKVPVVEKVTEKVNGTSSGKDTRTGEFLGLYWWWWIIFLIIALLCWLLPSPRRREKKEDFTQWSA